MSLVGNTIPDGHMDSTAEDRARDGRSRVYGPKVRPSRSHLLTPLGNQILDAAMVRTGQSGSTIAEHLLRLHGGGLTADEFADHVSS